MLLASYADPSCPPDLIYKVIREPQLRINQMFMLKYMRYDAYHVRLHSYGVIRRTFSSLGDRCAYLVTVE